jgi:hypothetical protein
MFRKVAIVAIATVSLAACGGTKTVYVVSTDAPDTTTNVVKTTDAPIATSPTDYWSDEDEFIADIEYSYGPILIPDSDVIDAGYLVCQTLQGGATSRDVFAALLTLDDPTFATAIVASAVINFCPEQQWKFA